MHQLWIKATDQPLHSLIPLLQTPFRALVKISTGVFLKETKEVLIFNSSGSFIKRIEPTGGNLQKINVSGMATGLYFLKIGDYRFKFLKS